MSRSNPDDTIPHPCGRWFEWDGSKGSLRYYDKKLKKQVEVPLPFNFILLDQLASVKGWNDKRGSGIYSNEVKDTRSEPLVVKAFKGGGIACGLYSEIKDTVSDSGGHFVLNCYMGYSFDGLLLGAIQFKGSALSAWMEFEKKNRKEVWKKGIIINSFKEGKKGAITFRTPVFEVFEISKEDDDQATELDRQLQTYLRSYFKRDKTEPVQQEEEVYMQAEEEPDIPF